jgi:cytoskeletal protein CcmA (bactofilin family)
VSTLPGALTDSRSNIPRNETAEHPESLIDAASVFDGLFRVGRDLRIEGQATGEIQCEGTLTVAEGASVSAKVTAASVVVAGTLNGEINCRERLQILPSGRVSGTVNTSSLIIQEGALYEGELHMRTAPGESRPQPSAARVAPSPSPGRGRGGNTNGRNAETPPSEEG